MKKLNVLLFSIALLGLAFYGLSNNSYYIHLLVNLSTFFIYCRITLVAILITYAFVPSVRLYVTKALLGTTGILLLSLGLISIGSPSLLGHSNTYMLIGDDVALIEGGILAIILSVELPARRSRYTARGFYYLQSLFAIPSRKLIFSPVVSKNIPQFENVLSMAKVIPTLEQLTRSHRVANKALT